MSTEEKPLHVRVAEKLGWTEIRFFDPRIVGGQLPYDVADGWWTGRVFGVYRPLWASHEPSTSMQIPEYDTNWTATGFIIERLGLGVTTLGKTGQEWYPGKTWLSHPEQGDCIELGFGTTPLLAVCDLLLKMPDELVRQ